MLLAATPPQGTGFEDVGGMERDPDFGNKLQLRNPQNAPAMGVSISPIDISASVTRQ
ncbi:MAG: hypothetical protein HC924_10370 [Synechococcaceae cyanobacterium SM2_3_2]|nr:hypothetical protein [Synechococcaceae cyanobacterium SM2_3_2]